MHSHGRSAQRRSIRRLAAILQQGEKDAFENVGVPDSPGTQRRSGMGVKHIQLGQGGCGGHTGCGVYADGLGGWPDAHSTSWADGGFTFPDVLAGRYTLRIEANGFRTLTIKDIVVNANQGRTLGTLRCRSANSRTPCPSRRKRRSCPCSWPAPSYRSAASRPLPTIGDAL